MTWSTPLSAALVETFLASTVLLVVALVLRAFFRHAALRVALAWGTFLGLAVLAVSPWVNVGPRLGVSEWFEPPATALPSEPMPLPEIAADHVRPPLTDPFLEGIERRPSPLVDRPAVSTTMPLPAPPAVEVSHVERRLSTVELALSGWTAGAVLAVLWILFGSVRAVRLLRRSREAPAWVLDEIRMLNRSSTPQDASRGFAPLQPRPRVRLTADLSAAAAVGAVRPRILLPAESVREENRLAVRAALAHEAAHIRHGDLWLLALERLLLPVYFAHPLFWWLRRQVRVDQELLADAAAAGEAPVEYAEALVAWARTAVRPALPFGLAAMSLWDVRTPLTRRVEMLLASNAAHRQPLSRRWLVFSTLFVLLLVGGLSRLTLQPAIAQEKDDPPPAISQEPAAPRPQAEAEAPPLATDQAPQLVSQLHMVDHAALEKNGVALGEVMKDVAEDGCQLEDEVIVAVLTDDKVTELQKRLQLVRTMGVLTSGRLTGLQYRTPDGEWSSQAPLQKTSLDLKLHTLNRSGRVAFAKQDVPRWLISAPVTLSRSDGTAFATVVTREAVANPDVVTIDVRLLKDLVRKPNKNFITVEIPRGSSLVLAELAEKRNEKPAPTPLLVLKPPFRKAAAKAEPPLDKETPEVTLADLANRGATELLTLTVTLQGITPAEAVDEVKPQLGRLGRVVPLQKTNRIVITDLAGNLRQIVNNLKDVKHLADETPGFDTTGVDARIRQSEQAFRAQTEAGSQAQPMDKAPAANVDEELRALELKVAEQKLSVASDRLEFVKRLVTKGFATAAQVTAAQVEFETAQVELLKLKKAASEEQPAPAPAAVAADKTSIEDKLLELDVREAELELQASEAAHEALKVGGSAVTQPKLREGELRVSKAQIALERAKLKLESHRLEHPRAALKPAAPEPTPAVQPAARPWPAASMSGFPGFTRSSSRGGYRLSAEESRGLVNRLFLDLLGRLPTGEEDRRNLTGFGGTQDYTAIVETILSMPEYREYQAKRRVKLGPIAARLQRTWSRTSVNGEPTAATVLKVDGPLLTIASPGGQSPTRYVVRVDESKSRAIFPAHLDLQRIELPTAVSRGLVKIEGDTLTICLGRPNAPRPSEFRSADDGGYPILMTFEPAEDSITLSGKIESLTERQLTLADETAGEMPAGAHNPRQFTIGPETNFVRIVDGNETAVTIDDVRDDDHAHIELTFPFDGPVLKVRLSKQPASTSAAPVRATDRDVSQRVGKAVVEVFGSTKSDGPRPPERVQRLGVVVDPQGYIVAPGFVASLEDLRVTLDRFTSLPAKILVHDDSTSLALLKVDTPGSLPHATWGEPAAVSQDVTGVFSQTSSTTCRVLAVNAQAADGDQIRKGLTQVGLNNLHEHQLGLPLFDEDSLVGVTTISRHTDGATMTYAQPADAVRRFVEQALKKDVE